MDAQRVDQEAFRKTAGDVIRRAKSGQQIIVVDGDGEIRMVIGTNGHQALFDVDEPEPDAIADKVVDTEQHANDNSWLQ